MVRIVCILVLLSIDVRGQVINSLSRDKTSFYGHALDTLTSILKEHKEITKIYVDGDDCVFIALPDYVQEVPVARIDEKTNLKRMSNTEVWLRISCIAIIRNEVKVVIGARERVDHQTRYLAYGGYEFYYYYDSEADEYNLKRIEKGFVQ